MINDFYYVTAATGRAFITDYTQYAIKSLLKVGVDRLKIHVAVNEKNDIKLLKSLVPEVSNTHIVDEDLSIVKWEKWGSKRKYSLFKAAALHKIFGKPVKDQAMIYFDGDVLWYDDPTPFFRSKSNKTWFHHGKDLAKRASIDKVDVDISDVDLLSKWCALPMAHLIVKWGGTNLPVREVVAGLYLLHPRDHERVLDLTYKGCLENSDKFVKHEGVGDQKPMNAAITVLNIDWHGGSRFFCPEHEQYFDHFFGKENLKERFHKKVKKLGLK